MFLRLWLFPSSPRRRLRTSGGIKKITEKKRKNGLGCRRFWDESRPVCQCSFNFSLETRDDRYDTYKKKDVHCTPILYYLASFTWQTDESISRISKFRSSAARRRTREFENTEISDCFLTWTDHYWTGRYFEIKECIIQRLRELGSPLRPLEGIVKKFKNFAKA